MLVWLLVFFVIYFTMSAPGGPAPGAKAPLPSKIRVAQKPSDAYALVPLEVPCVACGKKGLHGTPRLKMCHHCEGISSMDLKRDHHEGDTWRFENRQWIEDQLAQVPDPATHFLGVIIDRTKTDKKYYKSEIRLLADLPKILVSYGLPVQKPVYDMVDRRKGKQVFILFFDQAFNRMEPQLWTKGYNTNKPTTFGKCDKCGENGFLNTNAFCVPCIVARQNEAKLELKGLEAWFDKYDNYMTVLRTRVIDPTTHMILVYVPTAPVTQMQDIEATVETLAQFETLAKQISGNPNFNLTAYLTDTKPVNEVVFALNKRGSKVLMITSMLHKDAPDSDSDDEDITERACE